MTVVIVITIGIVVVMEEIRRSAVEVGSLSHYLKGFIHPRWLLGISSINSSNSNNSNYYANPPFHESTCDSDFDETSDLTRGRYLHDSFN